MHYCYFARTRFSGKDSKQIISMYKSLGFYSPRSVVQSGLDFTRFSIVFIFTYRHGISGQYLNFNWIYARRFDALQTTPSAIHSTDVELLCPRQQICTIARLKPFMFPQF